MERMVLDMANLNDWSIVGPVIVLVVFFTLLFFTCWVYKDLRRRIEMSLAHHSHSEENDQARQYREGNSALPGHPGTLQYHEHGGGNEHGRYANPEITRPQ